MTSLFGHLPPEIRTPPPGPRSRAAAARLAAVEAPGINTLYRGEPSLLWAEAAGSNVLDVDGNRYVDLTSGFGVAAIGHRHPRVVASLRDQSGRLIHGLGDVHAHPGRIELAERLAALAPVADPQIFLAVSGAEAVEIALKTAVASTGRSRILAFDPAYHGLTLGALEVTSRPEFRQPFAAHFHGRVGRLPFGGDLAAVEAALSAGDVAGVLVEPVVGREGVLFPPPGWLSGLADLCRRHSVLFIADEIFTGFGRTGTLFAVDAEGVRPDLLCCGKALGGGLPIAAVIGRKDVFACWETPGEALHTATFVAHPLACAAALAALDVLRDERLIERARMFDSHLRGRLAGWEDHAGVTAVRGKGLLWGIELISRDAAVRFTGAARDRGILLLAGGPEGRVAQIVPPLSIDLAQLDGALELLEQALS